MSTTLFIFLIVACVIGIAMTLGPPGPPKE